MRWGGVYSQKIETEDKINLVFELFEGAELFSVVKAKKKWGGSDPG